MTSPKNVCVGGQNSLYKVFSQPFSKFDYWGFSFLFQTSSFYKNCACVESKHDPIGKVEEGACETNCRIELILFMLVLSAITLTTFVNDTPALIVTLRYLKVYFSLLILT